MSCAFYLIMKYTCCRRCSKEKRREKDIEMKQQPQSQQPQSQHHQQDRKEEKEGCANSGNGKMPMLEF